MISNGNEEIATHYLADFCKQKLAQSGEYVQINGKYVLDEKGNREKGRKKTSNNWFETQDSISYWEEFFKPKICWASVGPTYFSCIPEGILLLDTNYFFASPNPDYLHIVLNSKLITWWINSEDTPIGGGGAYRHYKYNLQRLSIPGQIDGLAKLDLKDYSDPDLYDRIVFKTYGLTDAEIAFIDSSFSDSIDGG